MENERRKEPGVISRRGFLKGGAAAFGGIAAASALPAFADNPALFPQRGRWERLSIGYQHIDAGAEKPFTVLHISATHLTDAYPDEDGKKQKLKKSRSRTFGGRQEEALRDSLAWAKEHVDYVVHTGDMIDFQSRANFDLVRKYYGEGCVEMHGCLGNHEYSRNMEKAVENEAYKDGTRSLVAEAYPFDTSLASSVLNGVNFVSLDNVYGTITDGQMARLEAEFKKGLPIILLMHCPVMTGEVDLAYRRYWSKTDLKAIPDLGGRRKLSPDSKATAKDYRRWLKAQPLLKGILAGHLHFDVEDRFSPTAMQYVVGGNFLFHGQEIIIS